MKRFYVKSGPWQFAAVLVTVLVLAAGYALPARAGEPTGEVGPVNPTMFECIDEDGGIIELDTIQDIISNDATTETSSCTDNFEGVSDFGFDTTDSVLLEGFINRLEDECDEEGGDLRPIRRTRIEGFVYEFYPVDAANPQTSDWVGGPSRDVPVIARGIGFESVWGSEENGSFSFINLGAGPIELNLGLPPDAHPINPRLIVKSTGMEETIPVFLGFYRGNLPAPNISQLRPVDGGSLPFASQDDYVVANRCGLPMPDVGGTLSPSRPTFIVALALVLLVALPVGGLLKARRSRPEA
jgi:hypothetical protein